jgi:hypothetical protein
VSVLHPSRLKIEHHAWWYSYRKQPQIPLTLLYSCRREDPVSQIGKNLARIFQEKGHDFFDTYFTGADLDKEEVEEEKEKERDDNAQPMTPEELFKMRMEIMPQLQWVIFSLGSPRLGKRFTKAQYSTWWNDPSARLALSTIGHSQPASDPWHYAAVAKHRARPAIDVESH